jgi:hypothetical protein
MLHFGTPTIFKSKRLSLQVLSRLLARAKNFYRKDAKKQQTSSDFLSSFAPFASSR